MFPVRCYTCNNCIGQHFNEYTNRVFQGENKPTVMESLGIDRICCRRMFLTHVHLISDLKQYPSKDVKMDDSGTVMLREIKMSRHVSCS